MNETTGAADKEGAAYRSGIAVLVGRTNVGKSTLLNALVGSKIVIVTPKPQTTRDAIHGVVHRPGGQVVFVDTPGFFKTHASKLVESLHEKAREALVDPDVVVHVVDPSRAIGPEDEMVVNSLLGMEKPRILCINKCDLARRPHLDGWMAMASRYAAVVEVSGATGFNLKRLVDAIFALLPEGPQLYPEGQLSNQTRDFLLGELIREQVFLLTDEEVPYRTSLIVESVEEQSDKLGNPVTRVHATIYTPNVHYKAMLIGARGQKIKEIGAAARHELQTRLGHKVVLKLLVDVNKDLLQ